MDLLNKVCIVTGGAKGIGRSIAESLINEGAVVFVWDLDFQSLKASREYFKEKYVIDKNLNNKIITQKVNVTRSGEINEAIRIILQKFSTVDILINNAGLYNIFDITGEDENNWDKLINTNLKSVFLCIKGVLPVMIKNRYGKIVNISSISGEKESIFASPSYCASKAGVIGLTRCVAAQVAKYGINVNCVAPAITDTGIISVLNDSKIKKAIKTIPLGRIGKPEDIANAVMFLIKDSSNFITGETINVNGGAFME